jgi:hypothetical protein
MHLQALTPFMTTLTLTLVCSICARSHHQVSDDADTFTISPVVGYMMIGVGIVLCIFPSLPGAAGNISPPAGEGRKRSAASVMGGFGS